jgi:hypothetical protein
LAKLLSILLPENGNTDDTDFFFGRKAHEEAQRTLFFLSNSASCPLFYPKSLLPDKLRSRQCFALPAFSKIIRISITIFSTIYLRNLRPKKNPCKSVRSVSSVFPSLRSPRLCGYIKPLSLYLPIIIPVHLILPQTNPVEAS